MDNNPSQNRFKHKEETSDDKKEWNPSRKNSKVKSKSANDSANRRVINLFDPTREQVADLEVASAERESVASISALLNITAGGNRASPLPPSSPLHVNTETTEFPRQSFTHLARVAENEDTDHLVRGAGTFLRKILSGDAIVEAMSRSVSQQPLPNSGSTKTDTKSCKQAKKKRTGTLASSPSLPPSAHSEGVHSDDTHSAAVEEEDEESESPPNAAMLKLVSDTATLPPSRCLRLGGHSLLSQSPTPMTPMDSEEDEDEEIQEDLEEEDRNVVKRKSVSSSKRKDVVSSNNRPNKNKPEGTKRSVKSSSLLEAVEAASRRSMEDTSATALPNASVGDLPLLVIFEVDGNTQGEVGVGGRSGINHLSIGVEHAPLSLNASLRLPINAPVGEQMHFLERYAMAHSLHNSTSRLGGVGGGVPPRPNLERTTSASLTRNVVTLFVLFVLRLILLTVIQILRFFHIFVLGIVTWLAVLVNPYFFWFASGTVIFVLSHILIAIPINRFLKRNIFRLTAAVPIVNGANNGAAINFEEEAVDSLMDRLPGALLWLSHVLLQEHLSSIRSVSLSVSKSPTYLRKFLFSRKGNGIGSGQLPDDDNDAGEMGSQQSEAIDINPLVSAVDTAVSSLYYVGKSITFKNGADGVDEGALKSAMPSIFDSIIQTSEEADGNILFSVNTNGNPSNRSTGRLPPLPQHVTRPVVSQSRFPLSILKYAVTVVGSGFEVGALLLTKVSTMIGAEDKKLFSQTAATRAISSLNNATSFGLGDDTHTNGTSAVPVESLREAIPHPLATWALDAWHIAIAIETLINIATNTMINYLNDWETIPKQQKRVGAFGIAVIYFGLVVCGWDLFWFTSSELSLLPPMRNGWDVEPVSVSKNNAAKESYQFRAREISNPSRTATAFAAEINDLHPTLSISPTMLFIFRTLALYRFISMSGAIIRLLYRSAFAERAARWRHFRILQRPVMLRAVDLHWRRWKSGGELGIGHDSKPTIRKSKTNNPEREEDIKRPHCPPVTVRSLLHALFVRFPIAVLRDIILRPIIGALLSPHWWRRLRCYRFIPSALLLSYILYYACASNSIFAHWDTLLSKSASSNKDVEGAMNRNNSSYTSYSFLETLFKPNYKRTSFENTTSTNSNSGAEGHHHDNEKHSASQQWEAYAAYQMQSFPVFAVVIYIVAAILALVDFLEHSYTARPTSAVLVGDHREREIIVGDILRDGGPSAVLAAFALRCRTINELLRQLSDLIPMEAPTMNHSSHTAPPQTGAFNASTAATTSADGGINFNASSISSPITLDFSTTSNVFVAPPSRRQVERASKLFTDAIHSLYSNNDPVLLFVLQHMSPFSPLVEFYFSVRRMFFSSTAGHKVLLVTGTPIFADERLANGEPDPRYQQPKGACVLSPIGPVELPFPDLTAIEEHSTNDETDSDCETKTRNHSGGRTTHSFECTICCEEIEPMPLKKYLGPSPTAHNNPKSQNWQWILKKVLPNDSTFIPLPLSANTSDLYGIGVKLLPCGHSFHQRCILPWLETHRTCVLCRATVVFPPTCLNKALKCVGIQDGVASTLFATKSDETATLASNQVPASTSMGEANLEPYDLPPTPSTAISMPPRHIVELSVSSHESERRESYIDHNKETSAQRAEIFVDSLSSVPKAEDTMRPTKARQPYVSKRGKGAAEKRNRESGDQVLDINQGEGNTKKTRPQQTPRT